MLDDGNGFERKKPVQRTAEDRASIVAESYKAGQTVATVTLVCIVMLVNPFWADAWLTNVFQMTCDLLGAQFFADHLFNTSPDHIRDTGSANSCLP